MQSLRSPSRKRLAQMLSEAVPVVNHHATAIEATNQRLSTLARRIDSLEVRFPELVLASVPRAWTWRERLRWLVRGR